MLGRHPHTEDRAHCKGDPAKPTHPHLGINKMSAGLTTEVPLQSEELTGRTGTLFFKSKIIPPLNALP